MAAPVKLQYNWAADNPASPRHPLAVRFSDGGMFSAVRVDGNGAFGDNITAELLPQAQIDFVYGSHPDTQRETEVSGGVVSFADSMVVCTSDGSAGSVAQINTRSTARYRPGQGLLVRISTVFDAPEIGTRQLCGGDANGEGGLFFGVDSVTGLFGVCRAHEGVREIQEMTVSAASTGVETGTVTLDGTGFDVDLTSGTIEETAQEIAEGTYVGWESWAAGDRVYFMANLSEAKAGAMTFASTGTAAGALAEAVGGADMVFDWTPQADWNSDRMLPKEPGSSNGNGPSGVVLDPTKGNVYSVKLQYLGFGAVDFLIEIPGTGLPQLVHRIEYANTNTVPLMGNPTMNTCISASNVVSGSPAVVKSASMGIFTEGISRPLGPTHGADVEATIAAAVPVISVRNNPGYVNGVARLNARDLLPLIAGVATSAGNKPMKYSIIRGGELVDPLWTLYDDTHSIASIDTSATAVIGGDVVLSSGLAKDGDWVVPLLEYDLHIHPGQIMTIVMEPTGTAATVTASLSFKEDV